MVSIDNIQSKSNFMEKFSKACQILWKSFEGNLSLLDIIPNALQKVLLLLSKKKNQMRAFLIIKI